MHSLTWEEAQLADGIDPDFHRRDLADAIESGAYPEWDFGIQTFPDTPDQTFQGIDLLDPTKIVPEELAPVQTIGTLTLNANPSNFFAETEQIAFHTGHLVRGIDATDDPLLAARNFSYLDTQLTRLGGPNFQQIPINRPHAPVNDNASRRLPPARRARSASRRTTRTRSTAATRSGPRRRADAVHRRPGTGRGGDQGRGTTRLSYDDHFSQARMFWESMTPVEKDHIVAGVHLRARQVLRAGHQGARAPGARERRRRPVREGGRPASACRHRSPTVPLADVTPSPALSQVGKRWPTDGRLIGILVDENSDADAVRTVRKAVFAAGMVPLLIAPKGGKIFADSGDPLDVQRTLLTARSIEFDTILVAGALTPGAGRRRRPGRQGGRARACTVGGPARRADAQRGVPARKALGGWGAGRGRCSARSATTASPASSPERMASRC